MPEEALFRPVFREGRAAPDWGTVRSNKAGNRRQAVGKGALFMRGNAVMLMFALLLSGCAAPPAEEAVSPQLAASQTEDMQASLVESAARPMLREEILTAYEHAVRVYSWFDLTPLPASEETMAADGKLYRRVNMDGIGELEDLRTYLRSIFSQELADRLLDGETARIQYREFDGALYVTGEFRNRDSEKGAVRMDTEQFDETTYFVNVLVELLAEDGETVVGLESWSFPYALENDRWVFTDFRLVY